METVLLGGSGIAASRVGFGSDPIGGHGWGPVDDEAALGAIRESIDNGVNLFDTADCYGKGHSEELIGQAVGGMRDKVVLASKYGVRFGADGKTYHDNRAEWLREALDGSLKRLGTDYIDLYQVHWWDKKTPLEVVAEEMARAQKAGKIRAWGVTNVAIDPPPGGLPPVSFSYEYSLARRDHEPEILRTVANTGAAFLSWGSLGQGILTGKYDLSHTFAADDRRSRAVYVNFGEDGRARNLRVVEALREMQPRYPGRSVAQLALRWIMDRVPGSIVLVGSKRAQQAADNAAAMGWRINDADMAVLNSVSAGNEVAA